MSEIGKSQSFKDGLTGNPINTGGNPVDYMLGQQERERNLHNPTKKNDDDNGGCGLLIILLLAIVVAIPSLVAALIGSILILLLFKMVLPAISNVSFREIFEATFITTCAYLLTGVILALLQMWQYPTLTGFNEGISVAGIMKYFNFFHVHKSLSILNLLEFHLLCVSLGSLVLRYKMREYLPGFSGYFNALLITLFTILPSIVATSYIAFLLMPKYFH